jgi:hypothetical protein
MSTLYKNDSRSISNFIRWAHQRIEKEIEINEECERQFGSAEVFKDSHKLHNQLSNQEKLELVYEVNRLSDMYPNLTRAKICSMAGLHYTTYYKWRKQLTKKGLL